MKDVTSSMVDELSTNHRSETEAGQSAVFRQPANTSPVKKMEGFEEYVNWHVLYLLEIIKMEYPEFTKALVERANIQEKLSPETVWNPFSKKEDRRKEVQAIVEIAAPPQRDAQDDQGQRERLASLLMAVGGLWQSGIHTINLWQTAR